MEPDIACELLEKIREQPGIYLGDKDLSRLRHLLDGYLLREMEINPEYRCAFWDGFNRYVEQYYRINPTQGWRRIIEFFSTSRADAFDAFFLRYDEYLAAYREGKMPPPRL